MNKLGQFIGAMERGYNPADMDYVNAQAEVWDRDGGPPARTLIKLARDVMVATGRGHSAPAFHFHFLCKSADWNDHTKEVAQQVSQVVEVLEPMRKQAFRVRDAIGAGGTLGRGALLGSVAVGGGLGLLYSLLSRHANQDESDIEAMQRQVEYYNNLSRELESSMRRKYRYDRGQQSSITA